MMRRLRGEERELWDRLRRTVKPLPTRGRKPPPDAPPEAAGAEPAMRPERGTGAARVSPAPTAARENPPLAAFEEKLRRRLARGLTQVDARIDLHGMRQERAFAVLVSYLRRAQAHGAKIVLVITGKGREGEEGRGVLRQMVPGWLARPDMRDLVVGFEEAGHRHGGAGALYVRLRRRGRDRRAAEPE
jgi:DNA-nicking Smr family endonuclease